MDLSDHDRRGRQLDVSTVTSLITGGAGAVVVLVVFLTLILSDKLHTDSEFQRLTEAGERKDQTITELTKALDAASERGDAAVRASELIANAFTSTGQRRRRVPLESHSQPKN